MTRLKRLENRQDTGDSIWRRLQADNEQFMGFKDYDLRITNPDF